MRIIYLNPVEERAIVSTGKFRRVREASLPRLIGRPNREGSLRGPLGPLLSRFLLSGT